MGKKSRYLAYKKAISKREGKQSSPASILKRLRELKDQNVVISVPLEQDDSPPKQGGGGD